MAKRILVIDDEYHLLSIIQICLQKLGGWTVTTAQTGSEGLSKVEAELPDAILLDMMMPDMDGISVLKHLKENPATQTIPVILFTAKVQPANLKDYAQLQVAGIIAKPFDPLTLVTQMTKILGWVV